MTLEKYDLSVVYVRDDGSFVVNQGLYHVPNLGEWAEDWKELNRRVLSGEINPIPEPKEVPYQMTKEEIKKSLEQAVDNYLDKTAQDLGYRNIDAVAKYAQSTNQKFKAEYDGLMRWCTDVYSFCYDYIDAVVDGTKEIPTAEQLIAELPKLVIEYPEVEQ